MKFLKSLVFSFFTLSTIVVSGQLDLDETLTVEELVNEVLLGDGVNAFNITYNGEPGDQVELQAGSFNAVGSTFPIDSGVVMTTSSLDIVNTGEGNNTDPFPDYADPDLAMIAGFASRNASVIEFDFTVSSDSVKFNYIFASAEYPSFTCSNYNDVFGFFLSGPGITGPFEGNAKNIALIPGTDIQVGVNSVNSGMPPNAQNCLDVNPNYENDSIYFVSNNPPEEDAMQIRGHTVVLTAEEQIECGGTYHIKLAISNANDQALQSAVFLEAGSFQAFGEVFASFSPVFGGEDGGGAVTQPGFDSIAVAGCTDPLIELIRPTGSSFDTLYFALGGTAVQSLNSTGPGDYWVPGGFLEEFPPGVDTLEFPIVTINPNITDTLDILLIIYFTGCAGVLDSSVVEIPIAPPPFFEIFAENQILVCPADTPFLYGPSTSEGGLLPYIYDWFDLETDPDEQDRIFSAPEDQQEYTVRVTDQCEFRRDTATFSVINNFPPLLSAAMDPFIDPVCPNEPVNLSVTGANGSLPYFYTWSDSRNSDINNGMSATVADDINPDASTFTSFLDVEAIVTDSCGRMDTAFVTINYELFDSLVVSFTPLFDNCPETAVALESVVEGGAGDYTYTWTIEGESSFTDGFNANMSNTFINAGRGFNTFGLQVEDRCNRAGHDMRYLEVDENNMPLRTGADTHEQTIPYIKLDPLQNIITPNGDGQNEVLVIPGIDAFENASVLVYDRWGKLIYENNSYDAGTGEANISQGFSAEGFSDGSYFYVVNIDSGECVAQGNLQVVGGNE
jgi:gliding motility-associated-like protein